MSNGKPPTDPLADLRKAFQDIGEQDSALPKDRGGRGGVMPDWYAAGLRALTSKLDAAGMLGEKGGWLRQLGGLAVPQTGPAAAQAALLFANPEAAIPKLAAKGVTPFLARAALRGLTTGALGKAMGYPFLKTAEEGVIGSAGAEGAGKLAGKFFQGTLSGAERQAVTDDVGQWLRTVIGPYLPNKGNASPERLILAVLSDEPSTEVGNALNALKASHAHTPVQTIDLEPTMAEGGVVFERPGAESVSAPSKLTPGREMISLRHPTLRGGTRPFGEVWDQIQNGKTVLQGLIAKEDNAAKLTEWTNRLTRLNAAEEVIAQRVDPEMARLLADYGRTRQLSNFFWGSEGPRTTPKALAHLFEGRTGRLSWDGYQELVSRFNQRVPRLREGAQGATFTPEELQRGQAALRINPEGGMVTGEPGRGPFRNIHLGRSGFPIPWGLQMPRVPWMPGWEQNAGLMANLTPRAVQAIVGQAPLPRQEE